MTGYKKISDELDYNIENTDERLELVENLVKENDDMLVEFYDNHYNPHINQNGLLSEDTRVGKDLEALANYLLFGKDSNTSDLITDYKKQRNDIRESSTENIEIFNSTKESRVETNKSIIKATKIKVNKLDREEFHELKETGKYVDGLTQMIKSRKDGKGNALSDVKVRRSKWIRTDVQKDEIALKNELKRYIRFQSISKSEPDFNALSYLQFDNVEVIRVLIDNYIELKQSSYDDTYGYMKPILSAFEELIEESNFKDHIKDVLIWKIEKIPYDEMIQFLSDKYDIDMTKPKLSKLTKYTIPNTIVDTYKQMKEDWVYTFVFKGDYKTCYECKKTYLATKKYFNAFNGGLRTVCKECRRIRYQKNRLNQKVETFDSQNTM